MSRTPELAGPCRSALSTDAEPIYGPTTSTAERRDVVGGSRKPSRCGFPGSLIALGVGVAVFATGCSSGDDVVGDPEPSNSGTGTSADTDPDPDPDTGTDTDTDTDTDTGTDAGTGADTDTGAGSGPESVDVYFTNLDRGDIGEVFPVTRPVRDDDLPLAALQELLAGPTDAEEADGYSSWFSDETADVLRSLDIVEDVAVVDFDTDLPDIIPNASTSAGSIALLAELDTTLEQFPQVAAARYSLEGDRTAFYEWLQLAAPDDGAVPMGGDESPRSRNGSSDPHPNDGTRMTSPA